MRLGHLEHGLLVLGEGEGALEAVGHGLFLTGGGAGHVGVIVRGLGAVAGVDHQGDRAVGGIQQALGVDVRGGFAHAVGLGIFIDRAEGRGQRVAGFAAVVAGHAVLQVEVEHALVEAEALGAQARNEVILHLAGIRRDGHGGADLAAERGVDGVETPERHGVRRVERERRALVLEQNRTLGGDLLRERLLGGDELGQGAEFGLVIDRILGLSVGIVHDFVVHNAELAIDERRVCLRDGARADNERKQAGEDRGQTSPHAACAFFLVHRYPSC